MKKILNSRHPNLKLVKHDWELWRAVYEGGVAFRDAHLEYFSNREDQAEFLSRKKLTPIPNFAGAALRDVRNAIFQRMRDIVRRNGSEPYLRAIAGNDLGVDRRGSTMNAFVGMEVLTELLQMGRVGVYIDAPVISDMPTLAESVGTRPYLYHYKVENILNWSQARGDEPSEFRSVLLKDTLLEYDETTGLPVDSEQRYRLLWVDEASGYVMLQFFSLEQEPMGGPMQLNLRRIPFVLLDIGDSLLKDVAYYQIALLNLVSSDVNYALRANFALYVEQADILANASHLKPVGNEDGPGAGDRNLKLGPTQGRTYGKDLEPPRFINPSSEPLEASMKLQEKLERDVRRLINLAVSNLGTRTSAQSKELDNQGLEAGLSYVGLQLESAERQIAEHWAAYEHREVSKRRIATIQYPSQYRLKSDGDRIEEAGELGKLTFAVPGRTVKRELAKMIVSTLLSGKVDTDTLTRIEKEIDEAPYTTSDPSIINQAKENGLVGEQVASMALGFEDDEHLQAREDHIARILRIMEAQGGGSSDAGARGVADLSGDPRGEARREKELSRQTDLEDTTKRRTRGASNANHS